MADPLLPRINALGGVDYVTHDGKVAFQIRCVDESTINVTGIDSYKTARGVQQSTMLTVLPKASNSFDVSSCLRRPADR